MADISGGADASALELAVMTPGGWTVNGVCELEKRGFTDAVIGGLRGCK